ncbi:MAG TPA: hypothetical protein VHG28_06350 [Longimicrobiaceae bacterium]|nr:hypothetical protein [Longimicrobiaceae bacterium]
MRHLRISFVGQCHTVGYPGVPPDAAFPQVCRAALQSRRPGTEVELLLQEYYHPSQLVGAVAAALRACPRVVVIEVVGWLAVKGRGAVDLSRLPFGVRSAYQRVRHFRHVSAAITARLPGNPEVVHRVKDTLVNWAGVALGGIPLRHARSTVTEYEDHLDRAIAQVGGAPATGCVLQGPGAPNLALDSRRLPSDMLERYRAVEEMARRLAARHGVLYVDRWDTVDTRFFSSGSIRPTAEGHSTWGHLLADRLIEAGLV